jgi:SAM-dependent methyltransferase
MLAAPGKVIVVDMDQASLRAAETRAATSGAYNLRFQLAAAESLPSADEAFDLCFAHTLLEHVTEPGRALREMQRVVRKAGVIALRTPDWRQAQLRPAGPEFDRALMAFLRAHYPGSDPGAGGRQAGLVRDLGCEIVHEATVLVPQVGRDFARFAAERLRDKGDRSAAAVFDRWQLAEPVFEQAYCEIVART